jgi:ABC-type nitrate/sulfonate/bicarbonate transport system permease component
MLRLGRLISPWVVAVVIWEAVCKLGLVDPLIVASPADSLIALWLGIRSGEMLWAAMHTIARAGAGFSLAVVVGIPLGLVTGASEKVDQYLGGLIDGMRSLPATALFPVFLLMFGAGDLSRIAVVWFACVWAMAVYTAYGVRFAGATRRKLLRLHNADLAVYLLDGLLLPALPNILGGARVLLSISLVVTVAIEMVVGARYGLGQSVFDAQNTFEAPRMYAAVILTAFVGILINQTFLSVIRRLFPWAQI